MKLFYLFFFRSTFYIVCEKPMRLQTYKSYTDNKVQTREVGNCTECKGEFLRVYPNNYFFQFETVREASEVRMSDISGVKKSACKTEYILPPAFGTMGHFHLKLLALPQNVFARFCNDVLDGEPAVPLLRDLRDIAHFVDPDELTVSRSLHGQLRRSPLFEDCFVQTQVDESTKQTPYQSSHPDIFIYRPYSVSNSINAAIVMFEEEETEITGMIAKLKLDKEVADAKVLATMIAGAGTLTVKAVENGDTVDNCRVIGLLVNCKTETAAVYEIRLDFVKKTSEFYTGTLSIPLDDSLMRVRNALF